MLQLQLLKPTPSTKIASMAAKHFYRQGFLLLLFNFISTAALEKRFSDLKRCADEECSMLLCRGKAVQDFAGPDCRFLSFKKSETIYVYYKLAGRRADMWAGSVGSNFGYFPSDLIAVNHRYTDKELEVPTEETDFVCFDTGFDKFNNYDIDFLLGTSEKENDSENNETPDHIQVAEDNEKETLHQVTSEDLDYIPNDQNVLLPELDEETESPSVEAVQSDSSVISDSGGKEEEFASENETVLTSKGSPIPEMETTIGTTFDAVVTDEDVTNKVTPYEEEESKDAENHPEDDADVLNTPLLSFSEKPTNTPVSDSPTQHEAPPETQDDTLQSAEEKNVWTTPQIPELKTTFGTTYDAVITNDDVTNKVTPYEEEESKDVDNLPEDDVDVIKGTPLLSFSEEALETTFDSPTKTQDDTLHTAEEKNMWTTPQIPELKTTFGTTYDAVITNDDVTNKVTPYEEEESKDVDNLPEDDVDVIKGTPLLSFSEEALETTFDSPTKTQDDTLHTAEEKNMWKTPQMPETKTTIGTTFDAVITEEDVTKKVTPFDEDESEDVENLPEENTDVIKDTPLLSFSEEATNTPASDSPAQHEAHPETHDHTSQTAEEKNIWTTPQMPELKTTLGTTFDAVITNEDVTKKVTPYEEKDNKDVDNLPEENVDAIKDTLLLSFSEEATNTPAPEEKNMWTSIGDKVFSVVTGGGRMSLDFSSEEDEDEIEGEPLTTEYPKENVPEDHLETAKPVEHEEEGELYEDSEVNDDNADIEESSIPMDNREDLDNEFEENKTVTDSVLVGTETEPHQETFSKEEHGNDLDVQDDKETLEDHLSDQASDNLMTDSYVVGPKIHDEPHIEEEKDTELVEENNLKKDELLEDENALLYSQSNNTDPDIPALETETQPTVSSLEPEYSDSVMRLTLLRDHFTAEGMERIQRLLGLKNLYKLEAMFSDLDVELQSTRLLHSGTTQEIETALEGILEASENTILDEVEKMLDSHNMKRDYDHVDASSLDEETQILDDFQEFAFSLRQKYSTASDSTPLTTVNHSNIDQGKDELRANEEMPHIVEGDEVDVIPETESEDNTTITDEEKPTETKEEEEEVVQDEVHPGPDVSVEEDSGHFNKNKENKMGFSETDEIQKVPQATLEKPLDVGLGVEVEHSLSESLDSMESVSEVHEVEVGLFSAGVVHMGCILSMIKSKIADWTIVIISLLPEEWKPGETLYGCPWQAVVITALVGVITIALFFWRTVFEVKKKEYLVDEKRFTEQLQALVKEKNDALTKMSELQKQTEQLKENQKQSKETVSSSVKRMQDLESKVLEAQSRNEQIAEEKNTFAILLEEERANSMQYETRIEKLEKANEKLQLSRKKIQDALTKTTALLDEAKIREDARNVQRKCLEKEYSALKDESKTLKVTIKDWEDKHKELSEQIKSYHKSQKDLEDSLVLKDHNVEVLSELLADLDACDPQKGDNKLLTNGAADKKTAIKNRIKQMMDVSRVQTTLAVVEEERDRFMSKLLNEEKSRKGLEEQHQELEHAIATLKSEKSHVENQFKILQQKNEIMVEMYHQKENALQQRLTKEELERRSKENMLSEVGGKALEAEEQVKVLRQRISEMEEQMKKTEEVYKEQIKEQENKTHSNWVTARNAERALNQEKLESSKLHEKLTVLSSQLNDRRSSLFRPNSGQPAGPRQGDSYGPSPVSGGAPSPPIMIEGPRRPPSAPVGRRIDPYGPRPPSEPHGRYAENKHIPGMDMMGPRSSSPANMDTSTQEVDPQVKAEAQAEASTESPEPGPGSFIVSPIRDSSASKLPVPPHDPLLPPGRLPPPGPYRPPRPGPYHLPPGPPPPNLPPLPLPVNGHPGMPLPGPMGGDFGPRPANGHAFPPRLGPGHVMDPRGPPPPNFRPPPSHLYRPMPPPHGLRGPVGPRPPIPPDMRFPRDHAFPPMDLPPGVHPLPAYAGDAYGQVPPNVLQNSAGTHSSSGQDLHVKQEAPQDSARPATVQP
uniref:transport and Golgi organization protein 1 homolog isoform X1 n=1 Tax=Solea senegalensis TaxID=28829 RepID=UPI001CD8A7C1|nr:transport and Golgi organization protein 1 homolog isoform X1 [Solea senegalensis]